MKYEGKICPYCKTPFKEGDDIVVCSECEMPHHKECWIENKACTTFGCTGNISSANLSQETVCSKCGSEILPGKRFCTACGAPTLEAVINPYEEQNGTVLEPMPYDADVAGFVKENPKYYAAKFNEIKSQNKIISWNWAACLGALWFGYRKMYAALGAYLAVWSIAVILAGTTIGGLISIAVTVASGLFGNLIYSKYTLSEVYKSRYLNSSEKSKYIEKKGGTNFIGVIIAVAGILLISKLLG